MEENKPSPRRQAKRSSRSRATPPADALITDAAKSGTADSGTADSGATESAAEESGIAKSKPGELVADSLSAGTAGLVPQPRRVVGIGSSAGGLEALTALIGNLSPLLGASYVVVQHLSPTYRSMLVQLLGRGTPMAVREIAQGDRPLPNTIFIAPANRNVILVEGRFALNETPRNAVPKPSVNAFFQSLAEQFGEDAIGVILSGTGTDGSIGLREIKAAGGYTFAQDPATAKYSGMPQSALDTGCVDWMLPPEMIATRIGEIATSHDELRLPSSDGSDATSLKKLLSRVRQRTRVDFSGYKENTVFRRIARRMSAVRVSTLEQYLEHVEDDPAELDMLCQDLLISVTAFFRDRAAFDRILQELGTLIRGKLPGDEVRIWVAGCATGEEVYSLAILLSEAAGPLLERFRVQIFATDIDMHAMSQARKGSYPPAALEEIEPELRSRYFELRNERYEVVKALRDMVVFARQDLLLDPPFLRLDLVSCRNVLIYFQSDVQAKILATFHYALRSGGVLVLGRSENVHQQESLFTATDRDNKIFRREDVAARLPSASAAIAAIPLVPAAGSARTPSTESLYFQIASQAYLPPGVLVNNALEILHLHGNPGAYLNIADGKPAFDLPHLIRREFVTDLQALVRRVGESRTPAYGRARRLECDGENRLVRLVIHPPPPRLAGGLLLVCFEVVPEQSEATQSALATGGTTELLTPDVGIQSAFGGTVRELEDELVATREHLQAVIEELETTNEEMQALNEEVQAANEELQSSNEELETANEELQSTNEELTTVNEELQVKSSELLATNTELESIQNGIGFPLLVLDRRLQLERYNRPAAELFALNTAVLGAPLNSLKMPTGMADFSDLAEEVLLRGEAREATLSSSQRHYTLYITPNPRRGRDGGVIVFLVDQTDLRNTEEALRTSQLQLMAIMDQTLTTASLKDPAGRYIYVNRRFSELFGISSIEALGHTDHQIFPREMAEVFRRRDLEVMRINSPLESEEAASTAVGPVELLSLRFPLYGDDGVLYAVCTQSLDITSRKNAENALRLSARVVDRAGEGVVVTDPAGVIVFVNRTFERMSGYAVHELVGKPANMLASHNDGVGFQARLWAQLAQHGWWEGVVRNRRKDGGEYTVRATYSSVRSDDGLVVNYVGTYPDPARMPPAQS